jgi:hypothetical protein
MKYLAIVSILALSSCIITEEECEFENYVYEVSPELESWLPDSLSSVVLYRADNGFEESYRVRKVYTGTWNALPDHCNNERQYKNMLLESTITTNEMKIDVQSGPRGDELSVDLNNFTSNYNFEKKTSSTISVAINQDPWEFIDISGKHELLSHYTVNGKIYRNVLKITISPADKDVLKEYTPETVFVAKYYGVIAYTQFDGLSWKLIKY